MKKNILILLSAILFLGSGVSAFDRLSEHLEDTKLGTYTCPQIAPDKYTKPEEKCIVTHFKGEYGASNCGNATSKQLAEMIKANRCIYKPDTHKYYSCQYAEGSCYLTVTQNGHITSVGCAGNNVSSEKARQDFSLGKCYKE